MAVNYYDKILQHYESCWSSKGNVLRWQNGPTVDLPSSFAVLEFCPTSQRNMWTYATVCMGSASESEPIELHIFSAKQDNSLVELLTVIAYYHHSTTDLNLGHTVNFGRSWQGDSLCTYGFISLPYLDGPELENMQLENGLAKFYWLIPITEKEVDFKNRYGVDALEEIFESEGLDYLSAERAHLVQ